MRPEYFIEKEISTAILKKNFLSGLIEDFDQNIVIMTYNGEEIAYDYSSINLLIE